MNDENKGKIVAQIQYTIYEDDNEYYNDDLKFEGNPFEIGNILGKLFNSVDSMHDNFQAAIYESLKEKVKEDNDLWRELVNDWKEEQWTEEDG